MVDVILNAVGGRVLLYISAALLIVCIGLGVAVEIQDMRLLASKADVKRLEAEKANMAEKILDQNLAVLDWKAKAEEQAQRVKASQAQAEKVRTITIERVREVTVATIPAACPDAVRWAAEWGIAFNRRWEAGE